MQAFQSSWTSAFNFNGDDLPLFLYQEIGFCIAVAPIQTFKITRVFL